MKLSCGSIKDSWTPQHLSSIELEIRREEYKKEWLKRIDVMLKRHKEPNLVRFLKRFRKEIEDKPTKRASRYEPVGDLRKEIKNVIDKRC